jgi:hypothetical protein
VQNNERYLAFPLAVSQAFLEDTRIGVQVLIDNTTPLVCAKLLVSTSIRKVCIPHTSIPGYVSK